MIEETLGKPITPAFFKFIPLAHSRLTELGDVRSELATAFVLWNWTVVSRSEGKLGDLLQLGRSLAYQAQRNKQGFLFLVCLFPKKGWVVNESQAWKTPFFTLLRPPSVFLERRRENNEIFLLPLIVPRILSPGLSFELAQAAMISDFRIPSLVAASSSFANPHSVTNWPTDYRRSRTPPV